ncbi:hypothetical protein NECAME_04467 [Necator americanus]|uniref:Uncharacterized protein n=1 Tax=Necator americanus TaxID=51031 RepID=W2SS36_NECAM|nr:hypothetical protein NECAME_04467 [Necator americanus]ETN72564.1 hypothetical protein NECAME_04467 [Necator americanus]
MSPSKFRTVRIKGTFCHFKSSEDSIRACLHLWASRIRGFEAKIARSSEPSGSHHRYIVGIGETQ